MLVTILVLDANDNSPQFERSAYEIRIPETVPVGSVLLKVRATDPDVGLNGHVTYQFSRHTLFEYGHLFGVRAEAGKVFLKRELDYETASVYLLSVIASDRGPDSLQSYASVLIRLEDFNDNDPLITTRTISSSAASAAAAVDEDSDLGVFVAYVSVLDRDSGDNGRVYCFLDSSSFAPRSVDAPEFRITTAAPLDREECDSYLLLITCADRGTPARSSSAELLVRVLDVNDNAPKFSKDVYEATIEENADAGVGVVRVSAVDTDLGPNAVVSYWIVDQNATQLFEIDHETGEVRSLAALDREETDRLEFQVLAMDQGLPVRSSDALVRLTVSDLDDERPRFERDRYALDVRENRPPGFQVGQVAATDRDAAPFNQFVYAMEYESLVAEIFHVDVFGGEIVVKQSLDREETPYFRFPVFAISGNFTATTQITVRVTDVNDNRPAFVFPPSPGGGGGTVVVVSGRAPVGLRVARLKALDPDAGENASLTYYVSGGSAQNLFSVDPQTGFVSVRHSLGPFVGRPGLLLGVSVRDAGDPPMANSAELEIVVSMTTAGDDELEMAVAVETDGVFVVVLAMTSSIAAIFVAGVVVVVCVVRRRRRRRPLTCDVYKDSSSTSSSAASIFYHEVRRTRANNSSNRSTEDPSPASLGQLMERSSGEQRQVHANGRSGATMSVHLRTNCNSSRATFIPQVH